VSKIFVMAWFRVVTVSMDRLNCEANHSTNRTPSLLNRTAKSPPLQGRAF
jgi:hypothetical protein